jgi:hypothetical protein
MQFQTRALNNQIMLGLVHAATLPSSSSCCVIHTLACSLLIVIFAHSDAVELQCQWPKIEGNSRSGQLNVLSLAAEGLS